MPRQAIRETWGRLSNPTMTSFVSEARRGGWGLMAGTMVLLGALVIFAPIPFWSPKISMESVIGLNDALIVVTLCISMMYRHSRRWLTALPISRLHATAALLASRVIAGGIAVTIAITIQAALFHWSAAAPIAESRNWAVAAFAHAGWVLVALAPWSVALGASVGPAAAPWALLAVAVTASAVTSAEPGIARWVSYALPCLPARTALGSPGAWLQLLVHGAAVFLVATAIRCRWR